MTPSNMHRSISTDSDICVATQQKAVYNWYELHHSKEDVVDIYSLEWQRRITAWHDWFAKTYGTNHMNMDTAISFGKSENLDFRVLFFAQPIATFSLWHVLQAFYEIDTAVCGRASDAQETLRMWREMKPLEYLKSKEVRRRWTRELEKLNQEIECAALVGGALTLTVYGILGGVEKLETSLASLEEDLNFNDVEMDFLVWILETIRDAVDDRCFMIANILKVEAMDQDAVVSEEDKSLYGGSIGNLHQIRTSFKKGEFANST